MTNGDCRGAAVKLLNVSLALGAAASAAVAAPQMLPQQFSVQLFAAMPNSGSVARFYSARGNAPIWFRNGPRSPVANRLMSILQQGQIDGLSNGPQLARQVQTAVQLAQRGDALTIAEADRALSAAWVTYVQALRKLPKEIEFADENLIPETSVDRILAAAARAPSLERHLQEVSDVNPVYAELRSAALQLSGMTGGVLDKRTSKSLARARILPSTGRYVLVDMASQRLFMFDHGAVRDTMKVIVGRPDRATPLIASTIHYATFNPYWNPPVELIRQNVAPGVLREGAAYLQDRNYEVVAGWEKDASVIPPDHVNWAAVAAGRAQVRLRKKPGGLNPMGEVKFSFQNSADIYLHDTPEKALFNNSQRDLSLGCIRVEDAPRLAYWLLERSFVAPSSRPETHVQLARGIPIYLTYMTARVSGSRLAFAPDIYGIDGNDDVGLASAR